MSEVAKSIYVNTGQSSHSNDGTGQLRGGITGNDAILEEAKADGASSLRGHLPGTPTKSGPSVQPDRTLPVLGRYVRPVVLPPDFCGLEPHDDPRKGSLADVVRQAEKAETFCRAHRSEVTSKWMVHPLQPSHIGTDARIGPYVSPVMPTQNDPK